MNINIDDFSKVELRVGKVNSAERVEGSKKLLKLEVDLGKKPESEEGDVRQILSGIGSQYTPEDMVGRKVVVIANLEPRMMMGMESQGMLLAASDAESISLLGIDKDLAPGSGIH